MTPRPAPHSDALVIFGATGDLAHKMIFPSLQALAKSGRLTVPVIGVALEDWNVARLAARMRDGIQKNGHLDARAFAALKSRLSYVAGDYADPDTFTRLKQALGNAKRPLFYLAIPPNLFASVVGSLARSGLAKRARLVVEKPFGHDLASARTLNKAVHRHFPESSVFRIDHFLGKEPVENILFLRSANPWVANLWDRRSVRSVEITMAESFGIKGRGAFYEGNGAIRDVVQNHLLELIAAIAMDTKRVRNHASQREARSRILECIRPLRPRDVVRGQFRGYKREAGVAKDSKVETFAALRLTLDDERWRGVPFFLRTGKCLPVTVTEARLVGKLSRSAVLGNPSPAPANYVRLRIEPEFVMALGTRIKRPGEAMVGQQAELVAEESTAEDMLPYERLLGDAMRGDATLFARQDAVEAAWRIVDPVLDDATPVHPYEPGSWGPKQASRVSPEGGWAPILA